MSDRIEEQYQESDNNSVNLNKYDFLLNQYIQDMNIFPVLSNETIKSYFERIERGEGYLKSRVVESNLRLVYKIAKKYKTPNVEILDIIQEGNVGLIKAVDMYDYNSGYAFSTYASYWIKQKIIRYLDDKSRLIRIPVYLSMNFYKVKNFMRLYFNNNGCFPNDNEIAAATDISLKQIGVIKEYLNPVLSLETSINDDRNILLGDAIEDKTILTPEEEIEKNELKNLVNEDLAKLSERERTIIISRFEFRDKKRSFTDIGKELSCSGERVRQLEKDAITFFRKPEISKKYLDYYLE